MKFTPETLLQIYLDGSFTDEAQAEFDALVRRDPAFAEKVTQALGERLGPVPEELVNGLSTGLDAKIGRVWNQYKPSPVLRILKWGAKAALVLAAAGGLYFGGRLWVAKLTSARSSGIGTSNPSPSGLPATMAHASEAAGEKPPAPVSASQAPAFTTARVPVQTSNSTGAENLALSAASHPSNPAQGVPVLPPVSTNSQAALHSLPPSSGSQAPENAGAGSPPSAGGATAEGDSLRVAIDLEDPEKVDVTVFNSDGLLVRHLYNGLVPAGEHYVDWDGKDQLGNAVLPGDYTVILDRGGKKMSGVLKVLPNR